MFDLQLRHLDLEAGTLRLDVGSTKNGAGRVAVLTPELKAALTAQVARVRELERSTRTIVPWLFPHLSGRHVGQPVGDLRKTWARACRKAGPASYFTICGGARCGGSWRRGCPSGWR